LPINCAKPQKATIAPAARRKEAPTLMTLWAVSSMTITLQVAMLVTVFPTIMRG
jgi:hypothetical protein